MTTHHRYTEGGPYGRTHEVSTDGGETWEPVREPDPRPPWHRPFPLDALAPSEDCGSPAGYPLTDGRGSS